MNNRNAGSVGIAMALFVMTFCFVLDEVSSGQDRAPSKVRLILHSRKKEWRKSERMSFDLSVKNESKAPVRIPYVYDCTIEVDGGSYYTQFPKPKLEDPERLIEDDTVTDHGSLTLNDGFETVDAKTGKTSLNLSPGKHTLSLVCGAYRSNEVKFMVNK